MRVFVYEHITGGAFFGSSLPAGLARQGEGMLRSLVEDLAAARVDVLTTRGADLPPVDWPADIVPVEGAGGWRRAWKRGVSACHACWPIAPETGGVLAELSRQVLGAGAILLGSTPEAVEACGSKLKASRSLQRAGVPVVSTWAPADGPVPFPPPWVLKPDDGAGCEHTRVVRERAALPHALAGFPDGMVPVVQPYLGGCAASLALVCDNGAGEVLAFNQQDVRLDGEALHFHGTRTAPDASVRRHWSGLAERVAGAFPGLRGYVGVDLLQSPGEHRVLEVNPRLTTSYCGLSNTLGQNVALRVLRTLVPRWEEAGRVA